MANQEERLICWVHLRDEAPLDIVVDESIDSRRQGLQICICSNITTSCALYNEIQLHVQKLHALHGRIIIDKLDAEVATRDTYKSHKISSSTTLQTLLLLKITKNVVVHKTISTVVGRM